MINTFKNYKSIRLVSPKLKIAPNNWHEDFIVYLASVMKPKVYVELGLYQCKLFNRIEPYTNKLIGVDTSAEAGRYMKKLNKMKFINSTTTDYAKELKSRPIKIDMLFIDADHSRKSVMQDFNNFFPYVVDHGLILLHDGYPENKKMTDPGYCGDGYKAIEQFSKETSDFEMCTLPVRPGLTICRKRKKQVKWL